MELNKEQIIKALECCYSNRNCDRCPNRMFVDCRQITGGEAISLIKELTDANDRLYSETKAQLDKIANQREEIRRLQNRIHALNQSRRNWKEKSEMLGKQMFDVLNDKKKLTEENEDLKAIAEQYQKQFEDCAEEKNNLEYTLEGVMHFVDKWLDGAELEKDEVNRAATMREKTLQIVEKLTKENERLAVRVLSENHLRNQVEYMLKTVKSDTVREFAKRLNKHFCHDPAFLGVEQRLIMGVVDQIAKDMLEDGYDT